VGKLDINKIKAKLSKMESESVDFSYLKLKKGENNIRIAPAKDENAPTWVETGYHYEVGPNGDNVCCPKLTEEDLGGGKPCPICELVKRLRKSNDADDKKTVDDIKGTRRFFMNALDLDEPEKGWQVLPMGVTMYKDILSWITHPDYGDITDAEEGYNLIIKKSGDGRDTEYNVTPRKNPSPLSAIENFDADKAQSSMPTLAEIPKLLSYKEIQGILTGESVNEDDEDEEEEAAPPSKKPKAETKPTPKAEEPEEEGEDEEEAAPPSKKPAPKTEVEIPDGAPECFSKEFAEPDDVCDVCEFREECQELSAPKKPVGKPMGKAPSKTEEPAQVKSVEDTASKVKNVLAGMKKNKE
jgi:hypothetical protein